MWVKFKRNAFLLKKNHKFILKITYAQNMDMNDFKNIPNKTRKIEKPKKLLK